jgi:hypothetical protein
MIDHQRHRHLHQLVLQRVDDRQPGILTSR